MNAVEDKMTFKAKPVKFQHQPQQKKDQGGRQCPNQMGASFIAFAAAM
jgi:hypothetical protein